MKNGVHPSSRVQRLVESMPRLRNTNECMKKLEESYREFMERHKIKIYMVLCRSSSCDMTTIMTRLAKIIIVYNRKHKTNIG